MFHSCVSAPGDTHSLTKSCHADNSQTRTRSTHSEKSHCLMLLSKNPDIRQALPVYSQIAETTKAITFQLTNPVWTLFGRDCVNELSFEELVHLHGNEKKKIFLMYIWDEAQNRGGATRHRVWINAMKLHMNCREINVFFDKSQQIYFVLWFLLLQSHSQKYYQVFTLFIDMQ